MHLFARISLAALALVLATASTASADKLSDFKTAADKKGCEAIPYSSERSDCKTYSRAKDDACNTKFSCDLRGHKKLLETLKEKQKNLNDAKARNNKESASALEKTVADLKGKIDKARKDARSNLQQADKCISAREKVQKHFERVRSLVEREREEALKPFVTKLVDHYKSEKETHQRPIKEVEQARGNCDEVSKLGY